VFNIGPAELMVIFVLALLVFGPKKLPEVSRQIGRGIREFRRASDQIQGEIHGALNLDDDEASDDHSAAAPDDDSDDASKAAPAETSEDTSIISANGHSAGGAKAVPESTDGAGPTDDGNAEGPAASERAD
jgi:sec-independent protein translocase protein TatA